MSETPYTEEDLKDAAAGVYAALITDVERVRVAELITDEEVSSVMEIPEAVAAGGVTWGDLLGDGEYGPEKEFQEATDRVHALVTGAPDISEWAVSLGADGMVPITDAGVELKTGDTPWLRLMFAVNPEVIPEERRHEVVARLVTKLAKIYL